jgi:hypothetical protein
VSFITLFCFCRFTTLRTFLSTLTQLTLHCLRWFVRQLCFTAFALSLSLFRRSPTLIRVIWGLDLLRSFRLQFGPLPPLHLHTYSNPFESSAFYRLTFVDIQVAILLISVSGGRFSCHRKRALNSLWSPIAVCRFICELCTLTQTKREREREKLLPFTCAPLFVTISRSQANCLPPILWRPLCSIENDVDTAFAFCYKPCLFDHPDRTLALESLATRSLYQVVVSTWHFRSPFCFHCGSGCWSHLIGLNLVIRLTVKRSNQNTRRFFTFFGQRQRRILGRCRL